MAPTIVLVIVMTMVMAKSQRNVILIDDRDGGWTVCLCMCACSGIAFFVPFYVVDILSCLVCCLITNSTSYYNSHGLSDRPKQKRNCLCHKVHQSCK